MKHSSCLVHYFFLWKIVRNKCIMIIIMIMIMIMIMIIIILLVWI